MAHQHPGKRAEQPLTLLERGERVREEGRALSLDDVLKLSYRGIVVGARELGSR